MKIQNKIVCAIWFTTETKMIYGHYQLECFLKVKNDYSNGDKMSLMPSKILQRYN